MTTEVCNDIAKWGKVGPGDEGGGCDYFVHLKIVLIISFFFPDLLYFIIVEMVTHIPIKYEKNKPLYYSFKYFVAVCGFLDLIFLPGYKRAMLRVGVSDRK